MNIRLKRILVRIGLVLFVITVLVLGIRAVFNYTTGKRLEAFLAERKAEGKLLDRSEFDRRCDDRDNAAPLWRAAEELILLEGPDKTLLGKATDTTAWNPLGDEDWKKLDVLARDHRRAIDLILEAAGKPCFRSEYWENPESTEGPADPAKMIQGVRLLAVDALLKAEAGQVEEAVDEILAGMRFCGLCRDQPILIGYLVAMGNEKTVLSVLNRIISGRDVSAETLTKITAELKPEPWRKAMARTFEVEGVGALDASLRVLRGEKLGELNSQLPQRAYNWLFRPVLKSEIVRAVGAWEEMASAAHLPYFETEEARMRPEERYRSIPFFYRVNAFLFPHLWSVNLKEASLEALLDSARVGLACKIYRLHHGRFPEKISDLVPGILDKEPIDPFAGRPFFFRPKGDGFVVYSAGSNKKDDGGRSSRITQMIMEKDDDWAWREK